MGVRLAHVVVDWKLILLALFCDFRGCDRARASDANKNATSVSTVKRGLDWCADCGERISGCKVTACWPSPERHGLGLGYTGTCCNHNERVCCCAWGLIVKFGACFFCGTYWTGWCRLVMLVLMPHRSPHHGPTGKRFTVSFRGEQWQKSWGPFHRRLLKTFAQRFVQGS